MPTRHCRTVACHAALLAGLAHPVALHAQTFSVARAAIGGDGGTDYLAADTATGRVYVSRGTHVMVVDGATAKVLADIGDTPRVHGIAFAQRDGQVTFSVDQDDLNHTMDQLTDLGLLDLSVSPASLEELFLREYQGARQ